MRFCHRRHEIHRIGRRKELIDAGHEVVGLARSRNPLA